MTRLAAATATAALAATLAAVPAAAGPLFSFEIRGTFNNAVIDTTPIDGEFLIQGQTLTTGHSGVPGSGPVTAPLDTASLTLSYDGSVVATGLYGGAGGYGSPGGLVVVTTNMPPIFSFSGPAGGPFDLGPETNADSIMFEFTLAGTTTWLGFGGAGRNMGITIDQDDDGVARFDEPRWLARNLLGGRPGDVIRTVSYTPASDIAPIPLPAAGWLLLAALGGLAALRRRRGAPA